MHLFLKNVLPQNDHYQAQNDHYQAQNDHSPSPERPDSQRSGRDKMLGRRRAAGGARRRPSILSRPEMLPLHDQILQVNARSHNYSCSFSIWGSPVVVGFTCSGGVHL